MLLIRPRARDERGRAVRKIDAPTLSTFGLDLEDAVLGGLLLEGQIPQEVDSRISPDLFAVHRRPLANAILSAVRETGHCDPVVVGEKLRQNRFGINAAAEIGRLIEAVPSQAHLIPHLKLLLERGPVQPESDDSPHHHIPTELRMAGSAARKAHVTALSPNHPPGRGH